MTCRTSCSVARLKEKLFVDVRVVQVCGSTAALLGWIGPIQAALLHLGPDESVFLNSIKLPPLEARLSLIPFSSQPLT